MTSNDEGLTVLAERCEAATGPDRETDGAIAARLSGHEVQRVTVGPDHRREDFTFIDRSEGAPVARSVPRYTSSVDVALTLVPEGHWFAVGKETNLPWARCYDVERLYDAPEEYGQPVEAMTPALAICAAALKARARTV